MSKKEKKPMTKAKKSLLITLLVLVVLGVSTAVLLLIPPTETSDTTDSSQSDSSSEESSEEEDDTITLLSKQASDVDHIDVVNQNTSFTLRPKEVEETSEEESSDESSEDSDESSSVFFSVDGLDPDVYPVLDTAVNSAAKYGYTLTAEKLIGDADDYNLDECGLQDPVVQVTSTFNDGS